MPYPINTVHRLLLEDNSSFLLLEDGSSKIILDETVALDNPLNGATGVALQAPLTFVGEALPQPPAPNFSLFDQFNASIVNAAYWSQFTGGGSTITYDSTGATVTYPASTTSSSDGDLTSIKAYNLTGTFAELQVLAVPSAGGATTTDAQMRLGNTTNGLAFLWEAGQIYAQQWVAGVKTNLFNTTYSASTHRWWRIMELNGRIYWHTSTNGQDWIYFWDVANPIAVTSLTVLIAGTAFSTATSPGTFKFNNFNFPPPSLSYEVQVDTVNTFDSQVVGTAPATTTYFFNASDSGPTDSGAHWTNDANAFDGNKTDFATTTDLIEPDTLVGGGTNAPTSGGTISGAVARVYFSSNVTGAAYTSPDVALTTPSGGWTWTKVNNLIASIGTSEGAPPPPYRLTTNILDGVTNIGIVDFPQNSGTVTSWNVYKVEIDVTYTANVLGPMLDKASNIDAGFFDDTAGDTRDSYLLLEDNTSRLLLEDNTSKLLLNQGFPRDDYVTYVVPASVLTSSVTYYWRVRRKLNAGVYGEWSVIQNFVASSGFTTTDQTITGQSRITATTLRTLTGKARITETTLQTITGKSRIRETALQTLTGISRITAATLRTIPGLSRVTATTLKTITGKAAVKETTLQTITGKSRIQYTTLQTLTGKSRITETTLQTLAGRARVTETSLQTITGKARVRQTTLQTITGKARITAVTQQTITGKARITETTLQTVTGKSRITQTVLKTLTGVSKIIAVTNQTITGKAAIKETTLQTITGKSAIKETTLRTLTGVSRIQYTRQQTLAGVSRLTQSVLKTLTGVARVTETTLRTITGKARITETSLQTITGHSRITQTVQKTLTGLARVTASTQRTIPGKAAIKETTLQTLTGKARVTLTALKTLTGISRITASTQKTLTGVSRIQETTLQTITGKAKIGNSTQRDIPGVARIRQTVLKTLTGVARVQQTVLKTLTGKAAIRETTLQTISGKTRIKLTVLRTLAGKANIAILANRTITGQARIIKGFDSMPPPGPSVHRDNPGLDVLLDEVRGDVRPDKPAMNQTLDDKPIIKIRFN